MNVILYVLIIVIVIVLKCVYLPNILIRLDTQNEPVVYHLEAELVSLTITYTTYTIMDLSFVVHKRA